jgi:putative ABC transport system permease protein
VFNTFILSRTAGSRFLSVSIGLQPYALLGSDGETPGNEGVRSGDTGRRQGRLRGALVVTEVALALVLLIGAGLLIQSFWNLRRVDTGFRAEDVLAVGVALPQSAYPQNHQVLGFYGQLVERVQALPGVSAAGLASTLPLSGDTWDTMFHKEGNPVDTEHFISTDLRMVSPGLFKAMGIELVRGRLLSEQDREDAPGVVVINEAMARHAWPSEDPIGKRVQLLDSPEPKFPFLTVVGLVRDVKNHGLDLETRQEMYVPYTQFPKAFGDRVVRGMAVVARGSEDPSSLAGAVRGVLHALDPELPVTATLTLQDLVTQAGARRRFSMLLLGIFAGVAVALAAVGIYGILSHSVTRRTREIGVRMALGAGQGDVLRLVVGQGLRLTLLGLALGLGLAFGLTRLLSSLLFGVSATDPAVFAAVCGMLAAIALLASYLPARRAMSVDPIEALRHE